MRLSRSSECLSDLELDEWASDELEGSMRAQVQMHLASCPRCQTRHEQLELAREQFFAAAPSFESHAERFVKEPRTSRETSSFRGLSVRSFVSRRVAVGASLAAAAALALVVALPRDGETRSKGGASIGYFVKRGAQVEQGDAATVLHPGDFIRFTYTTDRDRYFALFDHDPQATVVYYPSGSSAAQVRAGRAVALDFSVELDETLGVERVHAVFCPRPFDLAPLRAALAEAGRLDVPSDCQIDTLTLRKEATR